MQLLPSNTHLWIAKKKIQPVERFIYVDTDGIFHNTKITSFDAALSGY